MGPAAWAVVLVLASPQQEEQQRRQQELEKLRDLESREFFGEPYEGWYVDYGAWFRPAWFAYRDGAGHDISRLDFDLRVWADVRNGPHQVYGRASAVYWAYADDDGPEGDDHEREGPRGDVVFYQISLGDALGSPERAWDLHARAGRQYVRLGTGLVYNGIGDGLTLRGNAGPFDFELLGLRSQPHEDDIDQSRPTADDQERYFAGGRVVFTGLGEHKPYAAVLIERDRMEEDPEFTSQDFEFDAEYYGAGLRGQVFPGLTYEVEAWIQRGERFAHLTIDDREEVRAHAFLGTADYVLAGPHRLRLGASYMVGSGDNNRFRITNSFLGNLAGTEDRAFLGFGFIPTGYALAPILSNLRIVRAGFGVRPLAEVEWQELGFDALEIGVDLYHYRKDKRDGGISDPFAGFTSAEIGRALDVYLAWAVLSDLSLTARYGVFDPGDAYVSDQKRPYYSVSIVLSF